MESERGLISILREGVDVIKMILFKKLKVHLSAKYPKQDAQHINRLSGTIINELFGTPNLQGPFASFLEQHRACVEQELKTIATELEEMRIPLTDALRIQFLCDQQEGIDSYHVLFCAEKLHVLIKDREVPLPANFLNLVRKLGSAFNLLGSPEGG